MEEIIYAELKSNSRFRLVKEICKRERVPAYDRIGGNMEYRTPVKGYNNLYQTIGGLSKKANWFLWKLMGSKNGKTNEAVVIAKDQSESAAITIAYKELFARGLAVRVCKQHYLLNPTAFIPQPDCYESVMIRWEALMNESEQDKR